MMCCFSQKSQLLFPQKFLHEKRYGQRSVCRSQGRKSQNPHHFLYKKRATAITIARRKERKIILLSFAPLDCIISPYRKASLGDEAVLGVFCEVKTRKFDALKSKKPLVIQGFSKSPIRTLAPNQYNPNQVFPVGDGFGLFVFFGKFEETHFRNGVVKRPESKPRGPRKKKQI